MLRLAEALLRCFSFKLSAGFALLQRGILTIRREGLGSFFNKAAAYLKRNKHSFYLGTMGSDYKRWVKKTSLTKERIETINEEIAKFNYQAKISIIMPVYNVAQIWLEKAIDSVSNQLYNNLELCIVDDASTKKHVRETLKKYSEKDSRIKIKYLKKNRGIAGASNEALALDPPPTQAITVCGNRLNCLRNCCFASRPMIAWKSRTIIGYGCGPITEPMQ